MKKKSFVKKSSLNFHTFALGFRVDFSEDSEPTDELGDKPGPEDAAVPPTESNPYGVPREFTDFVSPLTLPDAEPSIKSPRDPRKISWVVDVVWIEGA